MKSPHLVSTAELPQPPRTPVLSGLAGYLLELFHAMRNNLRNPPQEKQLRLLETLPLGGRRQLMLVGCGSERFLVGSGPESVQTIVKLAQEARGSGQRDSTPTRIQSIGDQA